MAQESKIKGGVIIIGSLFWENEQNAIQEKSDIDKGKKRKEWRDHNLKEEKIVIDLPTRYGRVSSSRICTYTMILSKDFVGKNGKGLIIPFKDEINFSVFSNFKEQCLNLGDVEGVFNRKAKEPLLVKDWCAISIWINKDKNERTAKIVEHWKALRENSYGYSTAAFKWSDGTLLNQDYTLQNDLVVSKDFDFLLLTYIQPKHKNILKNSQQVYPTPKEIAEAMMASGYQTYFCQNRASGIITAEDDEIISYLNGKK